MFGASVHAKKADKLARGKVVQVTVNDETTTAIIRSEIETPDEKTTRYGLEFIQPSESFLEQVQLITEASRQTGGEAVREEQLWLRTS